jgi:hypothetical protein
VLGRYALGKPGDCNVARQPLRGEWPELCQYHNFAIVIAGCALRSVVFGFAREVATAKGPSDLVQAWTRRAMKQFDVLKGECRVGMDFDKLTAPFRSVAC